MLFDFLAAYGLFDYVDAHLRVRIKIDFTLECVNI